MSFSSIDGRCPTKVYATLPPAFFVLVTMILVEKRALDFHRPVAAASRPLANQVIGAGIVEKVEQVLPDTASVLLHEVGCFVLKRS